MRCSCERLNKPEVNKVRVRARVRLPLSVTVRLYSSGSGYTPHSLTKKVSLTNIPGGEIVVRYQSNHGYPSVWDQRLAPVAQGQRQTP
jgi:hypothetical protein